MNLTEKYNRINQNFSKYSPKAYLPTPTDLDYQRGYIFRYFIQRANDSTAPIYEVSSLDISSIRSDKFYDTVSLRWRISGPIEPLYRDDGSIKDMGVKKSNQESIRLSAGGTMPNLQKYLGNLIQFHKK